jgi:hypothetical protein
MGNIFKTEAKIERKDELFQIGIETLERDGWIVSRATGLGKASVRRITKGSQTLLVTIRTTQDQWIAFPQKPGGKGWVTLGDVDVVLAVSVNDREAPSEVLVHWIDAKEMQARFDRAAKARGFRPHERRPLWIPLYKEDDGGRYAGGGAGLQHKPIARVPMNTGSKPPNGTLPRIGIGSAPDDEPFTIAVAKRRLAHALGVPESNIKISVEW